MYLALAGCLGYNQQERTIKNPAYKEVINNAFRLASFEDDGYSKLVIDFSVQIPKKKGEFYYTVQNASNPLGETWEFSEWFIPHNKMKVGKTVAFQMQTQKGINPDKFPKKPFIDEAVRLILAEKNQNTQQK